MENPKIPFPLPNGAMWFRKLHRDDNNTTSVLSSFTTAELIKRFVVFDSQNVLYYVFKNVDQFIDFYLKLDPKYRTFHEVIWGTQPQKIKFDIDIKVDETSPAKIQPRDLLAHLLDAIYATFFQQYCKEPTFVITTSSAHGIKYSYHVIIANYLVCNNVEVQYFTRNVMIALGEIIGPADVQYIDTTVNKSVQNFRILGSHKTQSDTRVKLPYINVDGHILENTTITKDMLMSTLIQGRNPANDSLYMLRSISNTPNTKQYANVSAGSATLNYTDNLIQVVGRYEPSAAHEFYRIVTSDANGADGFPSSIMLCYKRTKPSYCDICLRVHDSDNTFYVICMYTNSTCSYKLYEKCRHDTTETKRFIGDVVCGSNNNAMSDNSDKCDEEKTPQTSPYVSTLICNVLDGKKPQSLLDSIVDKNEYSEPTLRTFEVKPTLFVHAAMKMGKTKRIREYIDTYYPRNMITHAHIVFLSFRQTFSANIKARFAEFTLYSDVRGQIPPSGRLIIQIESLHRYDVFKGAQPPDLIILDESESIIEQLSSGLSFNTNYVFQVFSWLVRMSKHLIAMDANMGNRTYNTIMQIRKSSPPFYHHNMYKNAECDAYYITDTPALIIAHLLEKLESGFQVAFASTSRKFAKNVEEIVRRIHPDKALKVYSVETDVAEKRQHLADVNTFWKMLDVLIYTPTVTAGVSFEETHFDYMFGYFIDLSCSAETCVQMLGRVRNIRYNEYFLCIETTNGTPFRPKIRYPTTPEQIENSLIYSREHIAAHNNLRGDYNEDKTSDMAISPQIKIANDGSRTIIHDEYYDVWVNNTIVTNRSRNNLMRCILQFIADNGASIQCMMNVDEHVFNDASTRYIEANAHTLAQEHANIANAPDISHENANALLIKQRSHDTSTCITPAEYVQLERYRLREHYDWMGPIDVKFVATYARPLYKKMFRNLRALLAYGCNKDAILRALEEFRLRECENYTRCLASGMSHQTLTYRLRYVNLKLATDCLFGCGVNDLSTVYYFAYTRILESLEKLGDSRTDLYKRAEHYFRINGRNLTFPGLYTPENQYIQHLVTLFNRITGNILGITLVTGKHDNDVYRLDRNNAFSYTNECTTLPCVTTNNLLCENAIKTLDNAVPKTIRCDAPEEVIAIAAQITFDDDF